MMAPNLTSRSLRAAIINAILTVSLDTKLAYVIVVDASVMWSPATSLVFHLKSSILRSNSIWHHTNWWSMGTDYPSGKISNATLIFSISLDIASAHKVLLLLALRARACSTVLGSSMWNLWLFFKYPVCYFLMLATNLSLFLSTCLTHQLKACLWSIPCTTANSAVCTDDIPVTRTTSPMR